MRLLQALSVFGLLAATASAVGKVYDPLAGPNDASIHVVFRRGSLLDVETVLGEPDYDDKGKLQVPEKSRLKAHNPPELVVPCIVLTLP